MPSHPPTDLPRRGVAVDGAKLRRRRFDGNLTLMKLADSCGISHQYLSMIERGVRPEVSPEVHARICAALGVDAEAITPAKVRAA